MFNQIKLLLLKSFESNGYSLTKLQPNKYSYFFWPSFFSLFPLMSFSIEEYIIPEIGHLMIMNSKIFFGMMNLLTISIIPNTGINIPFLLIDIMKIFSKVISFIEYYDCTKNGTDSENHKKLVKKYAVIQNYEEKPNWYIKERTKYSLIKAGKNEKIMINMISDSIEEYVKLSINKEKNRENLGKLIKFRERMIKEGNPSSSTIEKIFGKEESKLFFEKVVMPMEKDVIFGENIVDKNITNIKKKNGCIFIIFGIGIIISILFYYYKKILFKQN